jgi:hypothetical protein
MKKSDFIKMVKETNGTINPEELEKTTQAADELVSSVEKLKDMGVIEDTSENDDTVVPENKNKENFVESKIFTIIAEAETPKISKKEILEYLKRNDNV